MKGYSSRWLIGLVVGLLLLPLGGVAQTGKEFWFDVPEVNRGHVSTDDNFLVYLHITSLTADANVVISLPAEPNFVPIQVKVPAGSKTRLQLSDPGGGGNSLWNGVGPKPNATPVTQITTPTHTLNLFYDSYKESGRNLFNNPPQVAREQYIENLLAWSESDMHAAHPYMNRTKKGVLMVSDQPINAYIEIGVGWNMDLISLKGDNAKGKRFVVPAQTNMYTADFRYYYMLSKPYNSFNIVATQDNTKIKIRVPKPIWINGLPSSPAGYRGHPLPAGEYIIWLNRGESSIITPYAKRPGGTGENAQGVAAGYQVGWNPNDRLGGAIVEVQTDEGSGGDIVVLTRDDCIKGFNYGNPDYAADQLVPLDILGTDYAVVLGIANTHNRREDHVYIVGTEDGTQVYTSMAGHTSFTLNAGEQRSIYVRELGIRHLSIHSTKRVGVYHVSAAQGAGAQRGGAVIPPLPPSGRCIGNTQVAFSRTKKDGYTFYLNLLAWDTNDPVRGTAIGHFKLQKQSATGFVDVTPADPEYPLEVYLNNRVNWQAINLAQSGVPSITQKWKWIQVNTDQIGATMQAGAFAYRLVNTGNVFHLGVMNGDPTKDFFYGYFSDFKQVELEAVAMYWDGTTWQNKPGSNVDICLGESTYISSRGPEELDYRWTPTENLFPVVPGPPGTPGFNAHKSTMEVRLPRKTTHYRVRAYGLCDLAPEAQVTVNVGRRPDLQVRGPQHQCGDGNAQVIASGVQHVVRLEWFEWDGAAWQDAGQSTVVGGQDEVMHEIHSSAGALPFNRRFKARATSEGCSSEREYHLRVYPAMPSVEAQLQFAGGVANECSPVDVTLSAVAGAGGAFPAGTQFVWTLGDGRQHVGNPLPMLRFENAETSPRWLEHRVVARDVEGVCRSEHRITHVVRPSVRASILLSGDTYCEGSTALLRSQLHGATVYKWRVVESGQLFVNQPTISLAGLNVQPVGAAHSTYTVELTAQSSNDAGACRAQDTRKLQVYARPRVDGDALELSYPKGQSCSPLSVQALARGVTHAQEYEWQVEGVGVAGTESLGQGPVGGGMDIRLDALLRNGTLQTHRRTLRLRLKGAKGCRREYERLVDVPATPVPRIASPPLGGCPDAQGQLPLNFTSASQLPSGSVERWLVSDDLTISGHLAPAAGEGSALSHTFENVSFTQPKPFRVWVEVLTGTGCARRDSSVVTVFPRVSLTYDGSYTLHGNPQALENGASLCTPTTVSLQSGGAAHFTWTFPDGSQETQPQVSRLLRNGGAALSPYTVHLRGYNDQGCSEELVRTYQLRPQLEARFEAELLSQCHPVRVRLLNTSRPTPLPPGAQMEWILGAGAPSQSQVNVVEFTTPGTHTIGLRIRDGECTSEAAPYQVSVGDVLKAHLKLPVEARRVCSGAVVEASDRSQGADMVEWDFGDGSTPQVTPASESVQHVYVNETAVPVTYTLRIRAIRRGSSCDSWDSADIEVYPQPRASSTISVVSSCPTVRISVHNNSSPPPDIEYGWHLAPEGGAGTPVERTLLTQGAWQVELKNDSPHEPARYRGVHTVTRTYAGGMKCRSETRDLPVVEVPPRLKVDLRADREYACSGTEIRFADRSTGGTMQHVWNFGDGTRLHTSQLNESVRHVFVNAGGARQDRTYTVRVQTQQVGVENGCSHESRIELVVHPAVEASMTVELGEACLSPRPVTLRSTSEVGASTAGVTTEYTWSPGDGQPNESRGDESPYEHAYTSGFPNQVTTFKPTLSVSQTHATSGLTCKDGVETAFDVLPSLQAQLRVSPESGCAPLPVHFRASSTGGAHLEHTWILEPGTSRAGSETDHVFALAGSAVPVDRRVVYELRNEHGCSLRMERKVTVYPEVLAAFTLTHDPQRCTPFDVSVDNGSLGATSYEWLEDGVEDAESSALLTDGHPLSFRAENGDPQQLRLARYSLRAYTAHTGGPTCESTATRTLEIPPALLARFNASATSGCTPLSVALRNASQGASQHSWSFGAAGSSQQSQPGTITLTNPSTLADRAYPVKLRVSNTEGCVSEAEQTITVYPYVEARFLASLDRGCAPLSVDLQNISPSPAYMYRWQLGDGTPDLTTQDAGTITYDNTSDPPAPRSVTVRLEAQLRAHPECRAESAKDLVVYPRVYADFDPPPDGCSPLVGRVTNTTRAYQGAATYRWELPDGRVLLHEAPTLDLVNPSPEQELPVTVRLVARSQAGGCEGTAERVVTVWPTPRAGFSFEGGNMTCPPASVRLLNTSKGYGLRYDWSLGDGTEVSTLDSTGLSHRFSNNESGIRAYAVELQVRSLRGCRSGFTQQLFAYPQVRSEFVVTPGVSGCSPFSTQLTSRAQNAQYYQWTFGDGGSSTHPHPGYRFVNSTTRDVEYEVRLHARSQYGCESESVERITVWPRPGASFALSPSSQTYPSSVITLENQSSPASDDWSYEWRFGDGEFALSRDPGVHEYGRWGPADAGFAFPVWLRVSGAHCSDSAVRYAVVRAPTPQARFSPSESSGCPPLRVQFYNRSLYGSSHFWEFGDGTTSSQPEPEHLYDSARRYHVRLTVRGDGGEHFSYHEVEVYPRPRARFRVFPLRPSLPDARVDVKNLTELGSTYVWDFGDGTVSSEDSPSHRYRDPGVYTVSLVARSEHGCVDSVSQRGLVEVVGGGSLRFPSAFSPSPRGSGDGRYGVPDQRNEVFHPFVEGAVREYRLVIFNRWGEQVFESQDVEVGWDGYRGGQLCPQDVYAWRASGTYYDGVAFNLRGDVTLLRQ